VLISDFIDEGYEKNLRTLAKRHDLVVIHLKDDRETNMPNLGIIPVFDKESRKTVWVNTSSRDFRNKLEKRYSTNKDELRKLCIKSQINYVEINTKDYYIPQLIKLFKVRNKSMKRD
jgi:predicted ferric reductase